MIHIGVDLFRNEYIGYHNWQVYSNNIGRIVSYEYVDNESVTAIVKTEKSRFALAGKPPFIRSLSCTLGWYYENEVDPEELKQIEEVMEKWGGEFYICDPRPVRACILAIYESFKIERARTEWSNEVYEADNKKITALLNESLDWTIDDAKEWMRRNKFHVFDKLEDYRYSRENELYLISNDELIDPYWTPKR